MKEFLISLYIISLDVIIAYGGYEIIGHIVQWTDNRANVLWLFVALYAFFSTLYLVDKLID